MKQPVIVEQHHEVLPAWAESTASRVISLDFHTDTLPAFQRFIEHGGTPPEFSSEPETIAGLLQFMRHDEHFDYALKSGIVDSIQLISHFNFTRSVPDGVTIYVPDGAENLKEYDVDLLAPEFFLRADKMLEDSFLKDKLNRLPEPPYILDIDLDYFVTKRSLQPEEPDFFIQLFRRAETVTIAMEKEWVKLLSRPGDNLTSEYILKTIITMTGS